MAFAQALTQRSPFTYSQRPRCRRQVQIQNRASSNGPESPRHEGSLLQQVKVGASQFSQRYDILSTSAGALVCTSFFWSRGQDPLEALWITFCATVAGLVINEVVFNHET